MNSAAAPAAVKEDEENKGGGGDGIRASSSSTDLGTVFRVVPNGLGKHGVLVGRGGSAVPGIAPSKRLYGSRSTPTIQIQRSGASTLQQDPHLVQGSSPGGGVSARSAWINPRSGSAFAEKLRAVRGRVVDMTSETHDAESSSALGGSRACNRELARSKSDCGSDRGGTGGEAGFFSKSRSANNEPDKNAVGSPKLASSRTKGASPAQRRNDDQLALDLAAVRSL